MGTEKLRVRVTEEGNGISKAASRGVMDVLGHEKDDAAVNSRARISSPGLDNNNQEETPEKIYITGWKLYGVMVGVWIALFLSTLETTIVSTSLVSITNAVGGFEMRDWVVTSYLLTYSGFLVIYAKLSDVFGRKSMMLLGVGVFTLSSILCGISSSITQLYVPFPFPTPQCSLAN